MQRARWIALTLLVGVAVIGVAIIWENATADRWPTVRASLAGLTSTESQSRIIAAQAIARMGDRRAIPFLILGWSLEVAGSGVSLEFEKALRQLADKNLGPDWRDWYLAYWGQELPKELDEFAIRLYTARLPTADEFLSEKVSHTISPARVLWGGVAKDGIPPLNNPKLITAEEATYLADDEMVFGAFVHGEARAYPLRILDWHEMLNDEIAGVPVVLSYCPLCGSALLYDRRVNGEVYTFGTSGLLYQSNKLMYDDHTKSLWSNLWGKPVIGPLVGVDLKLTRLTLTQTTWREWKELHPQTKVLALLGSTSKARASRARIQTGNRQYEPGSAYPEYRTNKDLLFPTVVTDSRLEQKAWVYGLIINGKARAYPMEKLTEKRIVNDLLNHTAIVLMANSESGTKDFWNQGGAVRAYERKAHTFRRDEQGQLIDEAGQVWQLLEEKLVNSATGETLARLEGSKAYWFGWVSFYPETELWSGESPR